MKRLDVNDPQVFDTWRTLYYDLTEAEQVAFGYDMEAKYPHQASFTAANYRRLFTDDRDARVLEIGGWKGELAAQILKEFINVTSWLNIDYCKPATEKQVCTDLRYTVFYPDRFHWFKDSKRSHRADIAIAAHVIEHLTYCDLWHLCHYLKGIPRIMFEAPIAMTGGNDWTGYQGTHVLECGWDGVNEVMERCGYSNQMINGECFLYTFTGEK